MAERCPCEGGTEGGPSTHKGVVHLSTCPHSTLEQTTRKFVPRRIRRVLGTRRVVAEETESSDDARPDQRRQEGG